MKEAKTAFGRIDEIDRLKSVYPLDDFIKRIAENAENGNLIVINKNKAADMLATIGVQPSEVSRIIDLAKESIAPKKDSVNTFSEKTSGKKQFSLKDDEYLELAKDPEKNKDRLHEKWTAALLEAGENYQGAEGVDRKKR